MSTNALESLNKTANSSLRISRHIVDDVASIEVNELTITPEMFMHLCPALIVQIDGHDCVDEPEPGLPSTYTIVQGLTFFM